MDFTKFAATFTVAGSILLTLSAGAAPATSGNAAPFGLEIGKATIADVKKLVPKHGDAGINNYSHGPQWETNGGEFDVEGLKHVTYIFDSSNVLVGVVLNFPKDPVGMMKTLTGKYKLISSRIDTFMNNGSARYEKGDSYIDINAPHMSFDMEVTYATKTLMNAFNKTVSDEAARKAERKKQAL
jgi:hypothetical protein